MTEKELTREIGIAYSQLLSDSSEYQINPEQADKFAQVYKFLAGLCRDNHGFLESVDLSPSLENGGLTANFHLLYVGPDDMQGFADMISKLSALTIDVVDGSKVCLSVTVPRVFVKT